MTSPRWRHLVPLFALALAALGAGAGTPHGRAAASQYLYLWTASEDTTQPDFLAVLDVTERGDRYGRLVTTLPVPGRGNRPHHTEHEMPADGRLFANGFGSGQSFVFDLTAPERPRLAAQFGDVEGYGHPHSFLRLPGGNVLATFQMRHGGATMTAGGLVELTPAAVPVRSSAAHFAGADPAMRVYSGAIVPALDRIVTTTTDMEARHPASRHLQVWRLSDLSLLHTFPLPDGAAGGEGLNTAEPRLLEDGRTVLVSTFNCGLYLMEGLAGDRPSARLVATFPRKAGTYCAVPVIAGPYYLVTVPAWSAVVSLDIRDPAAPREVSRVRFGEDDVPHWIAMAPDHRRVVATGYKGMQHRVEILRFDPATGALAIDERFREPGAAAPGYRMDDKTWPHGGAAKGIPHGAVFSRDDRSSARTAPAGF